MADSESEEQPKKKKAMKKLVLVKPNTRSTSQQFGSDADEVNALIRVLEDHLEGSEGNEDIPQVDINDLRTEIQGISKELIDEKTTVKKILPRLRHIATIIKLPGASKTSKGRWLYSEEIREEEKAISRAKGRPVQPHKNRQTNQNHQISWNQAKRMNHPEKRNRMKKARRKARNSLRNSLNKQRTQRATWSEIRTTIQPLRSMTTTASRAATKKTNNKEYHLKNPFLLRKKRRKNTRREIYI